MASPPQTTHPTPQLYLVTPPIEDAAALARDMEAVLVAAPIAAVLVRLAAANERTSIERIKTLAPIVQSKGTALLLDGHADLAAPSGADGAHLAGIDALLAALPSLKPALTVGVGSLNTRHDAMVAAERGADYVMFGEPDALGQRPSVAAIEERIAWWAEIFECPCVGYAAALNEVGRLAAVGADFVAVGDWLWSHRDGPETIVAAAWQRLNVETAA